MRPEVRGVLQRVVRRSKQQLVTRCADVTEVLQQIHKTEISPDMRGALGKCLYHSIHFTPRIKSRNCKNKLHLLPSAWTQHLQTKPPSSSSSSSSSSCSYPSIFRPVGSFPSRFVASHSFHCCITVSRCVSGDLL